MRFAMFSRTYTKCHVKLTELQAAFTLKHSFFVNFHQVSHASTVFCLKKLVIVMLTMLFLVTQFPQLPGASHAAEIAAISMLKVGQFTKIDIVEFLCDSQDLFLFAVINWSDWISNRNWCGVNPSIQINNHHRLPSNISTSNLNFCQNFQL